MLVFLRRNLALVTLLLVTLAVATTAYASLHNQQAQTATCRQVEALKTVVRQVLKQSENSLGRKGTAGFAYYRTHPQELAVAKLSIAAEIEDFKAHPC